MRSSATLIAVVVAGACTVFAAPIISEAAIAEGHKLNARWTVPYGTSIMAAEGVEAVHKAAENGKRWDLPQVPPGVWYMAAKAYDPNAFQRRQVEDHAVISSGPGPVVTTSDGDDEQSSHPMVIASDPATEPQDDAVATAQSQSNDGSQPQKDHPEPHHSKGGDDQHPSKHQNGGSQHNHDSQPDSEKHSMGQKFNPNGPNSWAQSN